MTPHSFTIAGNQQQWKNGSPFGAPIVQPAFQSVLTCPPLNPGNFVDATAWSFRVVDRSSYNGEVQYRYLSPPSASADIWVARGVCESYSIHPVPSTDLSDIYNRALAKLNGKVRGGLDLSIALAEAGTTTKMLRQFAELVRQAKRWQNWKRWLKRGQKDPSKDIANAWLQWTYGVRPLLSDLYGSAEEAANFIDTGIFRFRARATEKLNNRVTEVTRSLYGSSSVPVIRTITSGTRSVTIQLALATQSWDWARWTSMNPIGIAWELTPYSFVADWVYNIGGYLRNLETGLLYGSAFRGGFTSSLTAMDIVEETKPIKISDVFNQERFYRLRSTMRFRDFQRQRLVSYPLPRPPSLKVDLGSFQLMSGAALLRQLLR